jgi:ferredoxin
MAIPTTRTNEKGSIKIQTELCTGCGLCVTVCKDFSLEIRNEVASESSHSVFGCIACGHCMAICPESAIQINGRHLSADDLLNLPSSMKAGSFENVFNLLLKRRSVREFEDKPVEKELIDQILSAAQTAPMGIPPSDVHVLIFDSQEKLRNFSLDFCRYLNEIKWLVSGWFLILMRPFWGRQNDKLFRQFIRPLFRIYTEGLKQDKNFVTYDAPLGIYFYGSPYCDPADPVVAATYAMIAGESCGLGTCMLGGIHPMIQNGRKAGKFRKKWGIRHKSKEGVFVIFGYPSVQYKKGIKRTFAVVDYVS